MVQMAGGRNAQAVTDYLSDAWNTLARAQRRDGCFSGSWDYPGTAFHGPKPDGSSARPIAV